MKTSLDVLCPKCREPLDYVGLTTSRQPLQCPTCKTLYSNSMPCPLCHAITGADLVCVSAPVRNGPSCGWKATPGTRCSKCLRILIYPVPSNAPLYGDVDGCQNCSENVKDNRGMSTSAVRCTSCRRVLHAPARWRRFLAPWTIRWTETYCADCFATNF